jgi:hypothetical protein
MKLIKKHHFLIQIIGLYLLIVLLFAVINWLMFKYNTTSFLISDQLNKHVERYDFLDPEADLASYHKNAKDRMPITIREFGEIINPNLANLQAINDSLKTKEKNLFDCQLLWDSLSKVASGMREDSIMEFRREHLAGSQERIDSLKRYLEGKDSTEMIIEGKYVELAELQYEFAKKNAEVQSLVVQYIGNFIPDTLSLQIRKCNEDYLWISMGIQELESTRRDVSSKIRDLVADFHDNRANSVGFWDFLYYSICVSTSVSFGDIVPNNSCTRLLAIIELLLCLVLVGWIVDEIIRKQRRNHGDREMPLDKQTSVTGGPDADTK